MTCLNLIPTGALRACPLTYKKYEKHYRNLNQRALYLLRLADCLFCDYHLHGSFRALIQWHPLEFQRLSTIEPGCDAGFVQQHERHPPFFYASDDDATFC